VKVRFIEARLAFASVSRFPAALALISLSLTVAGCFNVQSPDLFLLTRTGTGGKLTLLVNDGGTIRCNGGPAKPLADKLLIQARDLAGTLDNDAKQGLHISRSANSVAAYTIKLQHGTISFPDTAARKRSELAQAELFAVQVTQGPCGLSG
jgi:hypothetical protein